MKLSVIIPCFNGAETIAVQLEALANQEWSEPWEVIVSNNGSTDESMMIVEQYRNRLPGLRIVNAYDAPSEPRLGVAHSYNIGIQAATGDAVAFCEADDEVAPGWVAAMGEALSEHDFVAGRLEYRKLNEAWLVDDGLEKLQVTGLVQHSQPPYLPHANGCNVGMKRSVYEAVGELDESIRYAWDQDYCWRVQQAGFALHFLPNAVAHYRLRRSFVPMYHTSRRIAKDHVFLRQKYGKLVRKRTVLNYFLRILWYLPKGLQSHNKVALAHWVRQLGWKTGQLQGGIQYFRWHQLSSRQSSGLVQAKAETQSASLGNEPYLEGKS